MAGLFLLAIAPSGGTPPDPEEPPVGTGQFPNALAGFTPVPTLWDVAGVDYPVGVPAGSVLVNPSTLSGVAGYSVNAGTHKVTVTGANRTTTLIDFSADGGWETECVGTSNAAFTKCKWKIGANNNDMLKTTGTCSNTSVSQCEIDGSDDAGAFFGRGILCFGTGLTVELSYIHNTPGDPIFVNSGAISITRNLIRNQGSAPGAHSDVLELGTAAFGTIDVIENTVIQDGVVNGTQGFQIETNPGGTFNGLIQVLRNTMIAINAGGAADDYQISVFMGITRNELAAGSGPDTANFEDNFFYRENPASTLLRTSGAGGTVTNDNTEMSLV